MFFLRLIWAVVHAVFANRADLVAENLALRQQLNVLRRKVGRPRLQEASRMTTANGRRSVLKVLTSRKISDDRVPAYYAFSPTRHPGSVTTMAIHRSVALPPTGLLG